MEWLASVKQPSLFVLSCSDEEKSFITLSTDVTNGTANAADVNTNATIYFLQCKDSFMYT
jgi:hypothetical protein